jgi:hypothetical protein
MFLFGKHRSCGRSNMANMLAKFYTLTTGSQALLGHLSGTLSNHSADIHHV